MRQLVGHGVSQLTSFGILEISALNLVMNAILFPKIALYMT